MIAEERGSGFVTPAHVVRQENVIYVFRELCEAESATGESGRE